MSAETQRTECASSACSKSFERRIGVRGRPQLFCSRLCANYARLMAKASTHPAWSFSYGTPNNHEKDRHAESDALKYEDGHEAPRRSPSEVSDAKSAPHRKHKNNSQPISTPKTGQGRNHA